MVRILPLCSSIHDLLLFFICGKIIPTKNTLATLETSKTTETSFNPGLNSLNFG